MAYKAGSIGAGRNTVMEIFEEKYKENMSLEAAILLGLEALSEATEKDLNPDAVEIGIVRKGNNFEKMADKEVEKYVKKAIKKSK